MRRTLLAAALSMGAMAAPTGGQESAPAPRVIHIVAERFNFTPSTITVDQGTSVELRISSDDTNHGFKLTGLGDVNVEIPKRGRGEVKVTFEAKEPGSVHVRMFARLRSGARVHARYGQGESAVRKPVMHKLGSAALVLSAVAFLSAWFDGTQAQSQPLFGNALPGVLPAEFERFRIGLEDFLELETAEEGLGPSFNAGSCAICHNVPAIGGVSLVSEVRAAYREEDGSIRPLTGQNGEPLDTLYHLFSNPTHGCQPAVPVEANIIARRIPIPTFGAGLVEAIPDETLIDLEDPDDRNGDGISGRAARVVDRGTGDRRIGRFGWKAQHATLRTFSADAYRNEMGITNEIFPDELAVGVSAQQMRLCDPTPDPEDVPDPRTRLAAIDNFEAFLKFLAPPPRGTVDTAARSGELVFAAIGCTACHVPVLETGTSRSPLFNLVRVPLYSDLLLHDVGTGDSIPQASARPEEIRTPSLWGLRVRRPFLHDGSAATPDEAIRRHGGEANAVRRRFEQLDPGSRAALLAFLGSL